MCLDFWRSRRSWSFQRCLNPVVVHVGNRRIAGDRRAAGTCRKARVDASTLEFCRLERRFHRRSFVEPPAVISTVDISCLCGFDGEFRPLAIADQRSCNGIDRETASAPNALCTPDTPHPCISFPRWVYLYVRGSQSCPQPGIHRVRILGDRVIVFRLSGAASLSMVPFKRDAPFGTCFPTWTSLSSWVRIGHEGSDSLQDRYRQSFARGGRMEISIPGFG